MNVVTAMKGFQGAHVDPQGIVCRFDRAGMIERLADPEDGSERDLSPLERRLLWQEYLRWCADGLVAALHDRPLHQALNEVALPENRAPLRHLLAAAGVAGEYESDAR